MFIEPASDTLGSGAAARRARSRLEMHDAILDAARRIVDEKGVEKLTIRGIAQALEYSVGAIYEYFDSKESILEALYFLGTGGLGDQMTAALEGIPAETSSLDRLITLAETYRAYAHRHVELYWLSFSALKYRPEGSTLEADRQQAGGFGPVLDVVQEGIADGTFVADLDPVAIAIAAWSAVHGFVSLELSGHMKAEFTMAQGPDFCTTGKEPMRRDDLFPTLTRMVLHGFVRRD